MFSFFTQRANPLQLDGSLPTFSESLLISATVKETHPEKAIASPVVIQPILVPKKGKKKHNAVIGNIETDAVKKVIFEPIIEIDDSILRPERSDVSLGEPEPQRIKAVDASEVDSFIFISPLILSQPCSNPSFPLSSIVCKMSVSWKIAPCFTEAPRKTEKTWPPEIFLYVASTGNQAGIREGSAPPLAAEDVPEHQQ